MGYRTAGSMGDLSGGDLAAEPRLPDGLPDAMRPILTDANRSSVRGGWVGVSRPVFLWTHLPARSRARAGVVLFPPIGHDYRVTHSTLRVLAERLADDGFAVVRFDYDGTGDSAGSLDDPDRVAHWLESAEAAVNVLKGCGVPWTAAVGIRVGASMASMVAERRGGIDALVLWDPISGGAYLTEQGAFNRLTFGRSDAKDGSIVTPGYVFDAETARDLETVGPAFTSGKLAERTLCLTRSDRINDQHLQRRFAGSTVEWGEAVGQADLMDLQPPDNIVPQETIEVIARWLDYAAPAQLAALVPPSLKAEAVIDVDEDGAAIVETAFVIGEAKLTGISTIPSHLNGAPTIVLLNTADDHRVGPNRMWVTLARRWARLGYRSVRFDLSGLGDSGTRASQHRGVLRAPQHFDDILEMTRHVSPHDPSDVVLIGLCSSGYQAIDSAFHLKPRGVCAINPTFSFSYPEVAETGTMDARRRVARHRSDLVKAFGRTGRLWPVMERHGNILWTWRNTLSPRRPSKWTTELVSSGVLSLFLVGNYEGRQIQHGAGRAIQRLQRSDRLRIQVENGLDHALMTVESRQLVTDVLTRHLLVHLPGERRPNIERMGIC
jgi:alpha-beta hydrolase superfamily lysophospholipase